MSWQALAGTNVISRLAIGVRAAETHAGIDASVVRAYFVVRAVVVN